ncbi:hypothetical protein [Acinetobacter marinus]|nr:hypothetical protein [Acinetobacter marinus]
MADAMLFAQLIIAHGDRLCIVLGNKAKSDEFLQENTHKALEAIC